MPGVDPADATAPAWPSVTRRRPPVPVRTGPGPGQERHQSLGHGHRAGPRTATAVGRGEGLVQVHVDDVEPHVPGPHDTEDGIEVGAVVVEEPTDPVDGGGDLGDVLLEEAERVRVGQHDAGHVLVEHRPQGLHVDAPPVVARAR